MAANLLILFLALISTTASLPNFPQPNSPSHNSLPLPSRLVAQAATKPLWLENIAVRPNGALLMTQLIPSPSLWTIKDNSAPHAKLEPVYTFTQPNITDLLGIYETYPDTYAIVAGNVSSSSVGYPGTFQVWEARFKSGHEGTLSVRKIANVPSAKFLNGITTIPKNPDILLIADSQFGLLFRLDSRTGESEVILDAPALKPNPAFGINGIRFQGDWLYFSNSELVKIFRVKISSTGYVAQKGAAKVEEYADLSKLSTFIDDFTFGPDGTLWATTNLGNTVVAVSPGGKNSQTVLGAVDQLTVAGGTAAAFGRGKKDKEVLYVVTSGALTAPVNGSITEPGKVVAMDTKSFVC